MSDTLAYTYVDSTGVIVADTGTILDVVQGEFTGVFGENLTLDSRTPQGVLIAAETLARSEVIQNNAVVANQINPNYSMGVFLDAVCALTGLEREADTYTEIENVTLTGVGNTPIYAGSLASTDAGDEFALSSNVTLNSAGTITTATFLAVAPGPIPCGAGTLGLVNVVTGVLGWETVSNAGTGTLGTLEQGDEPLRALRRQTLFLQGVALIGATLSAIADLTGVIGLQGLENYTSAPQTISGVYLKANSIWICVDGGASADIATALLQNKSMGCGWNGSQSLTVIEPSSGQAYLAQWEIPTLVPILVAITVRQGSYVGDIQTDVMAAILAFAANQITGITGFVVGESASPFEIAAGVQMQCPGIYVKIVSLALVSGGSSQPVELPMQIYQKATVTADDISVTVIA